MTKHRRTYEWVLVNVVALPLACWAVFLVVSSFVVGVSYSGVDLGLSLQFLPSVMLSGAVCGVVLGLVQGWALRRYGVTILVWTIATAIGMSLNFAVIYAVWLLRVMVDPFALGPTRDIFTNSILWVLSLVHGCSLAAVQWLALRRNSQQHMAAWPWLAGISWSILTPFVFVWLLDATNVKLIEVAEASESLVEVLSVLGVLVLFLPPLLLAIPYIILTSYLLERHNVT